MLKLTIENKEYEIPSSFSELTLGEYCRIFYNLASDTDDIKIMQENQSKIISRMLGENDDFLLDKPVGLYTRLLQLTGYIYDLSGFKMRKDNVKYLDIDGVRYEIKSPSEMSLRQYIDIDTTIKDEDNAEKYVELLSIMLVRRGEEYNGDYKELSKKVSKIPCDVALPIVFHFFLKGLASRMVLGVSSKEVEVSPQVQST